MSTASKEGKRKPRCSSAAGMPSQCTGIARWVTMNRPGNPTRMIWCDDCHRELIAHEFRVGQSRHQKLTPKLAAMMDRPWNWFSPTPPANEQDKP
jgi:hypothetical protein